VTIPAWLQILLWAAAGLGAVAGIVKILTAIVRRGVMAAHDAVELVEVIPSLKQLSELLPSLQQLTDLLPELRRMAAELGNNGGSSVKDAVSFLKLAIARIERELRDHCSAHSKFTAYQHKRNHDLADLMIELQGRLIELTGNAKP
jgi:hypothetical protein